MSDTKQHAFPTPEYYDEKPIGVAPGMTLRDYFAAHAMQSYALSIVTDQLFAKWAMQKAGGRSPGEVVADLAFDLADSMLERRTR